MEVGVAVLFFGTFVFYFSLCAFRLSWSWDFNVYISGVSALYENFSHPRHESMPVDAKYSFAFTPYILAVAAMGSWFSLTEYAALQWAGVFNLVLYAASILIYFRSTSSVRGSILPALFFLVTSLTLRNMNYNWSSETSIATLRLIQSYPSLFAWSLALLSFAALESLFVRGRLSALMALIFLIWALILVHQITASWVIGILGVRSLFELASQYYSGRTRSYSLVYGLSGSVIIAFVLAYFWPYSNLLALSGAVNVAENPPFGVGLNPLKTFAWLYVLAIPGFYLLAASKRGKLLFFFFLATVGAFAAFKAMELQYGYRYVFFMAFFAQVAVAEVAAIGVRAITQVLSRAIKKRRLPGWPSIAAGAMTILTAWAVSQAPSFKWATAELYGHKGSRIKGLWSGQNPAEAYYSRFPKLRQVLKPNDVVLINPGDYLSYQLSVLTGARSVVVDFAFIVPDYSSRKAAVNDFLTPGAVWSARRAVIERYGVTKILLTRASGTLIIESELSQYLGDAILKTPDFLLFDVKSRTSL